MRTSLSGTREPLRATDERIFGTGDRTPCIDASMSSMPASFPGMRGAQEGRLLEAGAARWGCGAGVRDLQGDEGAVVEAALAIRPGVDPGAAQEVLHAGGEIRRTRGRPLQLVHARREARVIVEQRRGRRRRDGG